MKLELDLDRLRDRVREIADFPKPDVSFKDVTPLLLDPVAFSMAVDALAVAFGRGTIDKVVGIEARGFIFAAPVAYHFGAGFLIELSFLGGADRIDNYDRVSLLTY